MLAAQHLVLVEFLENNNMAAYGKGQMLGSGINTESFKQDYSGFSRAAEIQAQGLSNLGGSIAGAIKDFGETKKEQKKVDAYNKASAKAIEAAITLGDSYGITGAEQTLRPFLSAYNDPNLSPIEKAAMLDEGKAMIPNVFGRFDKSQAMAIENARNAPPLPSPLTFKDELLKTDKGDVLVKQGSDGQIYDPITKYPILDLPAFGRGESPEVFSNQLGSEAANQIVAGMNLVASPSMGTSADGGPGVLPQKPDTNTESAKLIAEASGMGGTTSDVPEGLSPLGGGNVAKQARGAMIVDGPPTTDKQAKPIQPLIPRYISNEPKDGQTGTVMNQDQINQLVSQGAKLDAIPMADGRFLVTSATIGGKPMVEVNTGVSDQQKRAEMVDKDLFDQKKQLQGAVQNKDNIKKMISLIDEGVKTGFAQDAIMQFNRAFGKDVSNSETFKSVSGNLAMGFINLTKGAISDKEMAYFTTVLAPSLGNTEEGNRKIGEFMLKAVEKAEKAEKAISEGMRQKKNAFDIDEEVNKIRNGEDLIPESAVAPSINSQSIYEKHGVK
jgi:hypothetical protein